MPCSSCGGAKTKGSYPRGMTFGLYGCYSYYYMRRRRRSMFRR